MLFYLSVWINSNLAVETLLILRIAQFLFKWQMIIKHKNVLFSVSVETQLNSSSPPLLELHSVVYIKFTHSNFVEFVQT